ncbi:hypothetical protein, partial [Aquimarina macrocephali]|uniref:hypothetical protein n=1 Tax=Aquimarina macrocephali TaxID=666563 RepID=UPI000555C14D
QKIACGVTKELLIAAYGQSIFDAPIITCRPKEVTWLFTYENKKPERIGSGLLMICMYFFSFLIFLKLLKFIKSF